MPFISEWQYNGEEGENAVIKDHYFFVGTGIVDGNVIELRKVHVLRYVRDLP